MENKMEFRLATVQDLPQVKSMYEIIVEHMNQNQLQIWDEVYPCEFFEEDIRNNQLYVLVKDNEIVSACTLCHFHVGADTVRWPVNYGNAVYLDRLGVNVKYLHQGIGSTMLKQMSEVAKLKGASCVRLFVVDINKPARNLYEKYGFLKAIGVYNEVVEDDFILHEFGYELNLTDMFTG